MKLLTFQSPTAPHVGAVVKEGIVDLTRALKVTHPAIKCGDSMLAIVRSGIDIDRVATDCVDQLREEARLKTYLVENPKYLPPLLQPPKILALALNYPSHIQETNLDFFNEPIVFEKYPSTMVGHEDEIELPPFPQKVDEEHELALIVSRDCRHVRASQAKDYIFGYTICNDVSARQRQGERFKMGQPYSYAKNFATFCPMGPWIVTAKELPNPRQSEAGGAGQRQGAPARQHQGHDLRSGPGARLLLGLRAAPGGRRDLARHLCRRQGAQGRRHGRARHRQDRHAAQQGGEVQGAVAELLHRQADRPDGEGEARAMRRRAPLAQLPTLFRTALSFFLHA